MSQRHTCRHEKWHSQDYSFCVIYNDTIWKQLKCPTVEDWLNKLCIPNQIDYHADLVKWNQSYVEVLEIQYIIYIRKEKYKTVSLVCYYLYRNGNYKVISISLYLINVTERICGNISLWLGYAVDKQQWLGASHVFVCNVDMCVCTGTCTCIFVCYRKWTRIEWRHFTVSTFRRILINFPWVIKNVRLSNCKKKRLILAYGSSKFSPWSLAHLALDLWWHSHCGRTIWQERPVHLMASGKHKGGG